MKKYTVFTTISCILFLNLLSVQVYAFDFYGAQSASLAGAGVADYSVDDATANNPASLPYLLTKSIVLSAAKNKFRLSINDNGVDSLFPAALGYMQIENDVTKKKAFNLILAYPLFKKFSFGVNTAFLDTTLKSTDLTYHQTVLDAGLFYRFNQMFSAGLVLRNKALNQTDLDDRIDDHSIVVAGTQMQFEDIVIFKFELESAKNVDLEQKMAFKFALDSLLNEWLSLRLGYQNNNYESQNYFTAGLGFLGPQFQMHYAYVKESEKQKDTTHIIDLTIPF